MRVELVDEERAAKLSGEPNPPGQLRSLDHFPGGIARIGEEQRREPAAGDLSLEIVEAEVVSSLAIEGDWNRGEELEDVEQLLVRRVVGEEVTEIDFAERGDGPGQRGPASATDADVAFGVARLFPWR